MKIGGNWKPFKETDLRLRAEYVRSRLDRPVSSFPGVSAELEAAFPERFIAMNASASSSAWTSARSITTRRGAIRSAGASTSPSRCVRPGHRRPRSSVSARVALPGLASRVPSPGRQDLRLRHLLPKAARLPKVRVLLPAGQAAEAALAAAAAAASAAFGGGRQGGRLQFSLTHTLNLVDEVTIRRGLPELDYLNGDAVGSTGGRPRATSLRRRAAISTTASARASRRIGGALRDVDSDTGDDLHFSPLATFDLRLFANLGERFDLVSKQPWLRGTSCAVRSEQYLRCKAARCEMRLATCRSSYQPDLLDPLGRTVSISIPEAVPAAAGSFRRHAPPVAELKRKIAPLRRNDQRSGKPGLIRLGHHGRTPPEFRVEEQPVETTLYSLSDRTPDPVERRDGERYLTLFRVGTVMIEDRRELCLIKNISAGGMMIRPYCKLEPGSSGVGRAEARRADPRYGQLGPRRLRRRVLRRERSTSSSCSPPRWKALAPACRASRCAASRRSGRDPTSTACAPMTFRRAG